MLEKKGIINKLEYKIRKKIDYICFKIKRKPRKFLYRFFYKKRIKAFLSKEFKKSEANKDTDTANKEMNANNKFLTLLEFCKTLDEFKKQIMAVEGITNASHIFPTPDPALKKMRQDTEDFIHDMQVGFLMAIFWITLTISLLWFGIASYLHFKDSPPRIGENKPAPIHQAIKQITSVPDTGPDKLQAPEKKKEVIKKKPVLRPKPKKPFVPHYDIKLNKAKWGTAGFAHTLKRECGDCKRLCGTLKHDKGGLTCGGFSIRSNPDLFSKIINAEFQKCIKRGIYTPPGSTDAFGEVKDTCYFLRQAYWDRYIKFFKGCTWEALCILGDISILQGPRTAVKLLQRSHGIKEDGSFGPQTATVCAKGVFDIDALNNTRISAIKTYKDFQHFEKGWLSRIDKSYKFCKTKRRK